jgi:steroid 5-alpha reductase family enzyme
MMLHDLWFALAVSLLVQAVFFAFAASLKTDKVTDLSYGLTFVLIAGAAFLHSDRGVPAVALAAMVILWGLRLAGYLLVRIIHMGRDARFDGIRERFWPFFKFWLLQGIAVWVILLPVTLWFARPRGAYSPWMSVGGTIWLCGLVIEAVADRQKFAFKRTAGGRARWTDVGLWRYARHPNYFGELLCWWGIFVYAAPGLGLWAALGVLGPLAITGLLLFVTGIPPLEAGAEKRWGDDPEYQAYRRRTRALVPWPRRG